jgi:pathogenesis-related protein 1
MLRRALLLVALLAPPAAAQEILDAHNTRRAQHCVAPLAWSEELAAAATRVAQSCIFRHSGNGFGENLFIGTTGFFSPTDVVSAWYSEERRYSYLLSRFTRRTGHFTQMVWADTREVGCAMAVCGGNDLWVCNYSPNGNVRGRFRANVPRPC